MDKIRIQNEETVVIARDPRSPFFQSGFSPTIGSELVHLVEEGLSATEFALLWLDFSGGQTHKHLRLFIERAGDAHETPVTISDCTKTSSLLGKFLEARDPIPQAYTLEVSSPGLDRPLVRFRDFKKAQGKWAFIETDEAVSEGRKRFHGVLKSVSEEGVMLDVENQTFSISFSQVKKAKLDYFGPESAQPVKGKKAIFKVIEDKGV